MTRNRIAAFIIFAAIGLALFYGVQRSLMVLTGYSAKRVCSEVFVAGREPAHWTELDFLPLSSAIGIDHAAMTATSSKWGVKQTAVWRQGLGCAITPGADPDAVRAQGFDPNRPPPPRPLPERKPEESDIDDIALQAALDGVFKQGTPDNPLRTRAVVVLHRGHIVAERYGEGFTRNTPILGWSMTKSVTHALIGAAVQRELIDTGRNELFENWRDDERAAITLSDLLSMTSGLSWSERDDPFSDLTDMLYLSADTAAQASDERLDEKPGTKWQYSSGTANMVSAVLRDALTGRGRDEAYHRFAYESLFFPIGARGAVLEADAAGTFVGSSYLYMTAREWARFGQLYLQDGVWEGERVLPRGWAAYGCTPNGIAPNNVYGAHWWTNGTAASGTDSRPFSKLPAGACMAIGHEGQFLVIMPDRELVVVRLGLTFGSREPFIDFFARIAAAVPRRDHKEE